MTLQTVSLNRSYEGTQGVYRHDSRETQTSMTFSVYVPAHREGTKLAAVWYLSGLTCTHANVTEKGEFRSACAEHGLIFIAPDTSPRGEGVPGDPANSYDFGLGAGFYVDATAPPLLPQLPHVELCNGGVAEARRGTFSGRCRPAIHHGALHGRSRRADHRLAPSRPLSRGQRICTDCRSQVPWGIKALGGYLGNDKAAWRKHDAVALIEDGARFGEFLIDYGDADQFLSEQLRPELLQAACEKAGIPLTLRRQNGYDHSYYFISTFMSDHLRWHAQRLKA
jgi:S-formylglutathione hydrolase